MPKSVKRIAFVDDFLRPRYQNARRYIYETLEANLHPLDGIELLSLFTPQPTVHGAADFELGAWLKELGINHGQPVFVDWQRCYRRIPQSAAEMLTYALRSYDLIVTYEAPPWLCLALEDSPLVHLDLRMASLRFGPDLLVAMRSTNQAMGQVLERWHQDDQAMRHEAGLLAASLRHRWRGQEIVQEGELVFLGQTKGDASLINHTGQILGLSDYTEQLSALAQHHKTLWFRPHPLAVPKDVTADLRVLKGIYSQVHLLDQATYACFALSTDCHFVAISSGALSEAVYFGHRATALFEPIYAFKSTVYTATSAHDGYYHIRSDAFLSPGFWSELLGEKGLGLMESSGNYSMRPFVANALRDFHNMNWGYHEAVFADSAFAQDVVRWGLPRQKNLGLWFRLLDRVCAKVLAPLRRIRHGK